MVPETEWESFPIMSPEWKQHFTYLAWAQMNQNNPAALLRTFDIVSMEVQQYLVNLVHHSGDYRRYNDLMIQDLATGNNPLLRRVIPPWPTDNRFCIITPYSHTEVCKPPITKQWVKCTCHDESSDDEEDETTPA